MNILGIETSCDETAVAIVENGTKILSSVVNSSLEIHKKTGGIIPENAAREQVKYIIPALKLTLEKINTKKSSLPINSFDKIDAIAVTTGPGLIGSLLVGVETAKTIAFFLNKPLIEVNHVHAHPYANWLSNKRYPEFPILSLIVSGGHTELFFMKNHKDITWIGGTRDDAAGEAFDKTARLLGLSYPGGPEIAKQAEKCLDKNHLIVKLPRPMMGEDNFDFSFSGLKTATIREINRLKKANVFNKNTISQLASEIQESISDVLTSKTFFAARKFKPKSIILGGGVAANQKLSQKMQKVVNRLFPKPDLFIPHPNLCTDNASSIASFAFFHYQPKPWNIIQAKPDLEVEL